MIYSPTQTMLWDRCRFKWYLSYHLKIRDAFIGKRDIAACVGSAVSSTLAAHYKPDGFPLKPEEMVEYAAQSYEVELQKRIEEGAQLAGTQEEVKYPSLISPMLKAYNKTPPPFTREQVKGTEYQCGENNLAFIDIWGQNDRGYWVVDWKCKMSARPYQIDQELTRYRYSWQLGHYVWSVKQLTGEWPKTAGISLIVGEPVAQHKYMEYEVNPDFMEWWEMTAASLWGQIDAARKWLDKHPEHTLEEARDTFKMSTSHIDGVFPCDYTEPCMTYGGDVAGLSNYIQITRG